MIQSRGRCLLLALLALGFAAPARAQYIKCVTHFDATEGFDPGEEVLFQDAAYSGSNKGVRTGSIPSGATFTPAQVVQWTTADGGDADMEDPAYEIAFPFVTAAEDVMSSGVRSVTQAVPNLPNPSIHLDGKIRFKIAVMAFDFVTPTPENGYNYFGDQDVSGHPSILMCLGVRETGKNLPLGANDTGGGDLEYVYLPTSEVIPDADSDGLIPFPPGGKRLFASTDFWPPQNVHFQQVEFDLNNVILRGFANNADGTPTAGDGQLNATAVGDHVNRGILDSIIFTNDPADDTGGTPRDYFWIYIDDIEFEAPDPDPFLLAPSIVPPVTSTDTTVSVKTDYDACALLDVDSVGLYVDGVLIDDTPDSIFNGVATFSGVSLSIGDLLTARQGRGGVKSDFSPPVTVFGPGVVFGDNFDSYTSQAQFNAIWKKSIASPSPATAQIQLTENSAASCQNVAMEYNGSTANGARAYHFIGQVNGTDAEPLKVTWQFQHRGASTNAGQRFRFELARFANDTFSATTASRLPGTTGIILENGPSTVPLPQTTSQYNILLVDETPTNGFFAGNQGNVANTGVDRVRDEWHEMQIEVKSSVINYYVDGVLANPVDSNGLPVWPGGVPRPSTDPYNFLIIGQGFSNNGPAMLIDNVSVTLGNATLPFGPPNPVAAPTVSGTYLPGATTITVVDVDSNAASVSVFVDGVEYTTNGAGVFEDETATITVPALQQDDEIQATQTIGAIESCLSLPVYADIPAPTVVVPLVPGQLFVDVSNIEQGVASAVTVYRIDGQNQILLGTTANPVTDPARVTVPALVNGWVIRASQTVGGAESDLSAAVTVSDIPMCLVVFEDNFDTDTSADWNVVIRDNNNANDASATFAWDYGANADVPPSPNGDGSTKGLRFQANSGDATGAVASVTASPIGQSFSAATGYRLLLDLWINANGPFPAGGGGSTQAMTMGIGYDGITANQGAGTNSGSGGWFALTGEGGASRDVQAFKAAGEQFAESGQFAAGTSSAGGGAHSTNAAPANYYINVFGNTTTPPLAQSTAPAPEYPNQTGTLLQGSAGFGWRRADITTYGTKARWLVNGTTFVTLNTEVGTSIPLDGNISLGHYDPFASVADVPAMNFSVADNVLVLVPHTPGTDGDFDNDADVDMNDFAYFQDCLTGPGQTPEPRTGIICSVTCLHVFDADFDGDVDLNDYAYFQFFFDP